MTPELVITGARVVTMDAARPAAEALAVAGGRILAVGGNGDMLGLAGPGTRRIEAGGRLCLPGFIDAHCHLAEGGLDLDSAARLAPVRNMAELRSVLAAHAARWPGRLVRGKGWQPGLFGDDNLSRADIDDIVPDRPAILYDSSVHSACVNSAALAMAGLDDTSADPPNGRLVRDSAGRLTGMLHEGAVKWVAERLPRTDPAAYRQGAQAGMAHANRHGLTGISDPKVRPELAALWAGLARDDALTLRVAGAAHVPPGEAPDDAAERLCEMRMQSHGHFRLGAAKFFLDGVFENRTAALLDDYADARGGNAAPMFEQDRIDRHAALLGAGRFQLHFHCIGDAAARAALDAVAAATAANGPWPSLPQIAHCQLLDPADLPRFARLGAMANIQPLWARHDPFVPDIALGMIGPGRLRMTYAFRQLLAAGAHYCLSSDFPVSTLDPFEIIETAVTRQARRADGAREPFLPAEALTRAECVAGYTIHAARALWCEAAGRLAPGLSADLILLDRDIFACPADEIGGTRVLLTLFEGREVHRAEDF